MIYSKLRVLSIIGSLYSIVLILHGLILISTVLFYGLIFVVIQYNKRNNNIGLN